MNVSYLRPGEFSEIKTNVELLDVFNKIKHDKDLMDRVLAVRNGKAKKSGIGSYTPSGTFLQPDRDWETHRVARHWS